MNNTIDTGFWEKKWDDTLGYLVFKKKFSTMDVLNARFRYDRKKDKNFPIEFNETTFSIIKHRVPNSLNREEFWAAVVAPTQAFFDGDWKEYAPRGDEFREINLVRALNNGEMFAKLPVAKRRLAMQDLSTQLIECGLGVAQKVAFVQTPEISMEQKVYSPKKRTSVDEAINALEDLF